MPAPASRSRRPLRAEQGGWAGLTSGLLPSSLLIPRGADSMFKPQSCVSCLAGLGAGIETGAQSGDPLPAPDPGLQGAAPRAVTWGRGRGRFAPGTQTPAQRRDAHPAHRGTLLTSAPVFRRRVIASDYSINARGWRIREHLCEFNASFENLTETRRARRWRARRGVQPGARLCHGGG